MNGLCKGLVAWVYDGIEPFKGLVVVWYYIFLKGWIKLKECVETYLVYIVLWIQKGFKHKPIIAIPKECYY